MNTYADIFNKTNRYHLKDTVSKSRTWFQQQALLLSKQNITPQALIKSSPERDRSRIIPGEMYLFQYSAKHKDTLPYWDMFPLVFPFRKLPDGFIGLNMHYLSYAMRVQLLDRLMSFKSNQLMNENTRLKYSWATIEGVSRYKSAESCVHRYLINHVKSPFKKIDSVDWVTALMLPVEHFVGASKQTVWGNSQK